MFPLLCIKPTAKIFFTDPDHSPFSPDGDLGHPTCNILVAKRIRHVASFTPEDRRVTIKDEYPIHIETPLLVSLLFLLRIIAIFMLVASDSGRVVVIVVVTNPASVLELPMGACRLCRDIDASGRVITRNDRRLAKDVIQERKQTLMV